MLVLPSVTNASCGTTPPNFVIVGCQQLIIPNPDSVNMMVSNTEIMIPLNTIVNSANIPVTGNNFVIYNSLVGTTGAGWIEGNLLNQSQQQNKMGGLNTVNDLVVWLDFPGSLPASGSTTDWYIGYATTNTDAFVPGNNMGASALIFPTYGGNGRDNGWQVFNSLYCNFIGSSLCGVFGNKGNLHNNGITLVSGSGYITNTIAVFGYNDMQTAEFIGNAIANSFDNYAGMGFVDPACTAAWYNCGTSVGQAVTGNGASGGVYQNCNGGACAHITNPIISWGTVVSSVYYPSSDQSRFSQNYNAGNTLTTDFPSTAQTVGLSDVQGTTTFTNTYYVARIRTVTESGATPNAIIGPWQAASTSSLSLMISPNPVTYPTSSSATATCTPAGDICAVQDLVGNTLISSVDTAVYDIPIRGVGTYSYFANDLTLSQNSVPTNFIVNSNTPIITLDNCGFSTLPYSCTTTATFSTYHGQVTGSLFLNNGLIGASNTAVMDTEDVINQFSYVANTLATANYTANSVNALWYGYVPLQVRTYNALTNAFPPGVTLGTNTIWIPVRFFTTSPSNTIIYGLNEITPGTAVMQSGVLNVSFNIPTNLPTGNDYQADLVETQYGNTLTISSLIHTLNTTSIRCDFQYSTPIQYFPMKATLCPNPFPAKPHTWRIFSSPSQFTQFNTTSNTIGFVSNVLTYPVNIELTYLNGLGTFNITLANNPTITSPITFNGFQFNTISSGLITRKIINETSFDQSTFTKVASDASVSFVALFNNFTLSSGPITAMSSNNFQIYMPASNFQNPSIFVSNTTVLSQNTSAYFREVNNYCPATIINGNFVNWNPYLVPLSAGQLYEFSIFQGAGFGALNFYMIVQGVNTSGVLTQVQSYRIAANPFGDPLIPGAQYKFLFDSPGCGSQVFASALSTWISPIQITIPLNISIPSFPVLSTNVSCSVTNTIANCAGNNPQNFVYKWQVVGRNITSILGTGKIFNQTNITGASFAWSHSIAGIASPNICVYAYWGTTNTVRQQVYCFNPRQNTHAAPIEAGLGLIAIFLITTFVMFGKGDPKLTLIMTLVGLFLGAATAIIPIPPLVFYGLAAVILILAWLFEGQSR